MDPRSGRTSSMKKNDGDNSRKSTVASPIKSPSKITLGFRGFKLINSNIKLVKQVDVKTSSLKPIVSSPLSLSKKLQISPVRPPEDTTVKLGTAEALKKIRERLESRKKLSYENKPAETLVTKDEKAEIKPSNDTTRLEVNGLSKISAISKISSPPPYNDSPAKTNSDEISSPVKKPVDFRNRKSSPDPNKTVHRQSKDDHRHASSTHGYTHRRDEIRKRKDRSRSRSPYRERSPRSNRDRSRRRNDSSRERSSRHSPSRSHKSNRSSSSSLDSNSRHQNHHRSENRRSSDSERRRNRRDSHHHTDSSKEKRSSTSSDSDKNSTSRKSKQNSVKLSHLEDKEDLVELTDVGQSLPSNTDVDHATQSGHSSIQSDVDSVRSEGTELSQGDTPSSAKEEIQNGSILSPSIFSTLDSVSSESAEEDGIKTCREDEKAEEELGVNRNEQKDQNVTERMESSKQIHDEEENCNNLRTPTIDLKSNSESLQVENGANILQTGLNLLLGYDSDSDVLSSDHNSRSSDVNPCDSPSDIPADVGNEKGVTESQLGHTTKTICTDLTPKSPTFEDVTTNVDNSITNCTSQEANTTVTVNKYENNANSIEAFDTVPSSNANDISSSRTSDEENCLGLPEIQEISTKVENGGSYVLTSEKSDITDRKQLTIEIESYQNLDSDEDIKSSTCSPGVSLQENSPPPSPPYASPSPQDETKSDVPPPPPADQLESKIPTISSKLKNVFESLLQADFNMNSSKEMASNLPKINGIVHTMGETVSDEISTNQNQENELEIFQNFVENKEIKPVNNFGLKCETDLEACSLKVPKVTCLKLNNVSSSNKLKLHATTKTPLPAKKSYIQQAQITNEIDVFNEQHAPPPPPPPMSITVTSSPQKESESDEEIIPLPDIINIPVDDLPMPQESSLDSGLSRQDSNGSGPSDTDEGLRRSARIRTKKSEKTKPFSFKFNSTSDMGSSEAGNDPTTERTNSPTSVQCKGIMKLSEMSETDYFKMRINLAEGTEDVPEMFNVLEENDYLNGKKKSRARKEIRRMVCECEENFDEANDIPCGENCLNRLLMIECSSRCPFGDHCTNKRFQQKKYAPTEVFKTDFKGWGIRAANDIPPGQLIMEYCGEVVDQREFTARSLEYSESNHAHFYFMALSQDEIIDATFKGNSSRFINHSCDPNAETQKWTVNGRLRVGFFTLRDISKGEEITFDYQFERYGKVAQKCYCGTAKCRGYLGRAPDDEKKSSLAKVFDLSLSTDDVAEDFDAPEQSEKSRKKSKKKLSLFEDDSMEKDLSKLLGGLWSTKEVLALSRLMVRCDTHSQRMLCLRVLKETTSQTRLKTFLQFHGLSIIWSWMVDISGLDDSESHLLKLDIIDTLTKLPINNKNVIEDSKVLSVVQRWAKGASEEKSPTTEESEAAESKTAEEESKEKIEEGGVAEDTKEETTVVVPTVEGETKAEVSKDPTADASTQEEQEESTEVDTDPGSDVKSAAEKLLYSWKDLREIFRIPKRQKPASSPDRESRSRETSNSRTSSPQPKRSHHDDQDSRSSRRSWRGSSQERWWDGPDHGDKYKHRRSDHRDGRYSPNYYGEGRWESGRRKRRFSTDSDEMNGKVPWHNRQPLSRMSRQEYRKKFEKDVQKREEEKKRRIEEISNLEPLMSQNVQIPLNNQLLMHDQTMAMVSQDLQMMGQPVIQSTGPTFTSSGYSGNLIQINPTPQPQIGMQTFMGNQQIGAVSQVVMQPNANPFSMQMQQQGYNMQGIYTQDPNMQGTFAMNAANMQAQGQLTVMGQQVIANTGTGIMQAQQPMIQQQPVIQQQQTIMQPVQQQPASNVTILGAQNGQAIVLLSAEQLQKLTGAQPIQVVQQPQMQHVQPQNTTAAGPAKQATTSSKPDTPSKSAKNPESKQNSLPPNWKMATDSEGRIYYYHGITRQTQWDAPTWDWKELETVNKKETEMDLSTPTYDERQQKNNKSTDITEEGKKAKDTFRIKLSKFVVNCLSSFRKKDCRVGKITSTDDFKHVARKLTHNIMMKEIKQVQVWEDLDFNANVKHKTKEYVKKYMSKVGPIYRIRDDNPFDPS